MKTQKELNELKEEIKTLNTKLAELNEEELEQVIGGVGGSATLDIAREVAQKLFDGASEMEGISLSEAKHPEFRTMFERNRPIN